MVFVAEGDMVPLIDFAYNTCKIILMGGLNGLRGRCGSGNDNVYSVPTHNKLFFPCFLILLSSSVKYLPVHINSTLEIYLCLLSDFFFETMITNQLIS